MKISTFLIMLTLVIVFVTNCSSPIEYINTTPSETALMPPNTIRLLSSSTALPISLSTPTFAPTLVPTLPIDQAQARLVQLLSDNGNCQLPCLWGITPGKSDYQDAQYVLEPLTSISVLTGFKPTGGAVFPVYSYDNLELQTSVGFNVDVSNDQIINRIGFKVIVHKPLAEGGFEDVFDSNFFDEKITAFTLSHILTEQGVPSFVMLSTLGGPFPRGGQVEFNILLLYPNQGILVNYKTRALMVGTNVSGCPVNAHVQMELYPQNRPDLFFEGLTQTDWGVKINTDYRSIDDVMTMSAQQFYDVFHISTNKCIEMPTNLWPTPES